MRREKNKRKYNIIFFIGIIAFVCVGCSLQKTSTQTSDNSFKESEQEVPVTGFYDSADTAIVIKKPAQSDKITLQNLETGKHYTLTYDRTTYIYDKYGEALAMSQIQPGDIVDVTFYKQKKRLNSIALSKDMWTYSDVTKFEFSQNGKNMKIVEDFYSLYSDLAIFSNNKLVDMMDISMCDILTVRGYDRTIYSITVDKGHGYLRLKNDEYFINGWIEIGQTIIQPISEGMLLTVPEGSYQVLVSNKGVSGTKDVLIERNKEVELDIGDLKGEDAKIGNIIFSVTPKTAVVYVDGEKVNINEMVPLEYGIHQMIVKADGYKSITQYLKVGTELATIDVEMENKEETEEEDESISQNTVSANNVSTNNPTTNLGGDTTYKVIIDSPKSAEVYIDGNYIGIAPVNFTKSAGNHTITLRQSGYETRSYTVIIGDEPKDVTFSFSDLVKSSTSDEEE